MTTKGWEEVREKIKSMPKEEFIALVKKALDDSGIPYTEDDISGIDLASAFSFETDLEETDERKKGEWQECEVIDIEDTTIEEVQSQRCSVCGRYLTTPYLYYFKTYNFCPNCGAEMR